MQSASLSRSHHTSFYLSEATMEQLLSDRLDCQGRCSKREFWNPSGLEEIAIKAIKSINKNRLAVSATELLLEMRKEAEEDDIGDFYSAKVCKFVVNELTISDVRKYYTRHSLKEVSDDVDNLSMNDRHVKKLLWDPQSKKRIAELTDDIWTESGLEKMSRVALDRISNAKQNQRVLRPRDILEKMREIIRSERELGIQRYHKLTEEYVLNRLRVSQISQHLRKLNAKLELDAEYKSDNGRGRYLIPSRQPVVSNNSLALVAPPVFQNIPQPPAGVIRPNPIARSLPQPNNDEIIKRLEAEVAFLVEERKELLGKKR